jgi:hypothetical protein
MIKNFIRIIEAGLCKFEEMIFAGKLNNEHILEIV